MDNIAKMRNDPLHYAPPYEQTIQQINGIYSELDKKIEQFRISSGLKCPERCGRCCMSKNIEATVLEFLPLASHLWEIEEAEKWIAVIHRLPEKISCVLFESDPDKTGNGRCKFYPLRGLICRAFGYTASGDKYSVPRLIGCGVMRERAPEIFDMARRAVSEGLYAPLVTVFSYRLMSVDSSLGSRFLPINQAILAAIERIGLIRSFCVG
jgi:uncharacterized protein